MSNSWIFKRTKKPESVKEQIARIEKKTNTDSDEVTRCTESAMFDLDTLKKLKTPETEAGHT